MEITVIDDQYVEQEFQRIDEEIISGSKNANFSLILEGLCGKDVSKIDMSNLSPANFRRLTFDSKTIFSDEQIKKFHPEKLLEQGKSFSNGMERLHTEKIDGRGTTIGIIDSCFDSTIVELKGRVVQHIVFEKLDGNDFVSHNSLALDENGKRRIEDSLVYEGDFECMSRGSTSFATPIALAKALKEKYE